MKYDFLPICKEDMHRRGWDEVDFVYVTGDAYVDHPSFGQTKTVLPSLARRDLRSWFLRAIWTLW